MAIDVAGTISDLLYEYNSITIPGLGGLVANYKEADIQKVEGNIHPPSKTISFNSNLVINDGLLVERVRANYNLSYEAAETAVTDFVNNLQSALKEHGSFEIAKVGTISKRSDGYYFQPSGKNFNTSTFGLPSVKFSPIRTVSEEEVQFTRAPSDEIIAAPTAVSSTGNRSIFWIVSAMAVAALIISFFVMKDNFFPPEEEENTASLDLLNDKSPNKKINQKPTSEDRVVNLSGEDSITTEVVTPVNTEAPTPDPTVKEAIVIIGSFKNRRNANALLKAIVEAGYDSYRDGGASSMNGAEEIYRIGAKVRYNDPADFKRYYEDIKKRFNSDAFILKK